MSGIGDLLGSVVSGALSGANQQAGSSAGGGGNAALIGAVMTLINQHGGIGGLVQQLQSAGLGGAVQSWIGTGQNQSVDAGQITKALDGGALGQFAQQLGLDHGAAGNVLAQMLPQVVDHLTPNGQVGEHDQLGDLAKQLLGNSRLFG
ncbi:MAG: YidB family protein [Nevskia sp.]